MPENVVFLQQGRHTKNAYDVQNNISNDTSNTIEARCYHSQEDIHGIEGYTDFSKKVLNALEAMGTDIKNIKVRVTHIEIDIRNSQDTKSNQRCPEFMNKTHHKI